MRVLVGLKRVIDYAVKVRVSKDGSGVAMDNVKMSMNPFCEIACEEAIRLKEAKIATEIVAVSIGPKQAVETLRSALAMGADRAIHIATDVRLDQEMQPLATAKLLKAVVEKEAPSLVILGKQSIDTDNATTGPMLAELLDWPLVTFASKLKIEANTAIVDRETDTGIDSVQISLPAVITADLRLNTPRYPKLPSIMKAKKKPVEALQAESFGVDLTIVNSVKHVDSPPPRPPGITVESVDDLISKLKAENAIP
mmetsp:Transcript_7866/g.11945  ORF Transcript_7866/g.11945 Transcript_7866/m.11945 type:complete len:254 (+) Transcript_7866:27-788(+)|eukprot:CAMPEP_0197313842 /NCGR_PEP_ID=MMETSP0891-20130614/30859_1 /TAXON_ID=44058 ORGANISM="Aureoumbra lagunensis, Strain CCMP1510" /NCGR_SAMPLE_ID=MMETSP0891 /ASSEMBLY_ACC=CAM_ASM_000534 /LENGTH=253 /DNA_ID=CAMNT_0042801961 /DNA_START=16 /DNA_END=777 /DNA_ORIENTATION=-